MNTTTNNRLAAVNTLIWAAFIAFIIQAGVILMLPQNISHSGNIENLNMGLPLFNFLNS
jgi:hypothetical protein